jgi:ferritin
VLSDKLQQALNEQINAEYHSGYLYLAMCAYFESLNLDGCSNWMRIQAQEELLHGMRIFDYLTERGAHVVLQPVEGPPARWDSPQAAFKAALGHEQMMTRRINDLADLAQTEKDHATNNLMQWFVNEQVEEEANVEDILRKLELVGEKGPGLFMIDRELKSRVFTPDPGGTPGE